MVCPQLAGAGMLGRAGAERRPRNGRHRVRQAVRARAGGPHGGRRPPRWQGGGPGCLPRRPVRRAAGRRPPLRRAAAGARLGRCAPGGRVRPAAPAVRRARGVPGHLRRRLVDDQRLDAGTGSGGGPPGDGVDSRRRLRHGELRPPGIRRRAPGRERDRRCDPQLPARCRGFCADRRCPGQPGAARPGRGPAVGAGQHPDVRRRPGPGHRFRAVGGRRIGCRAARHAARRRALRTRRGRGVNDPSGTERSAPVPERRAVAASRGPRCAGER